MVLSAFGVYMEEARLRDLTDCSPLGTDAFQLLEVARQLGFPASRKYALASLEELATVLEDGNFPIVDKESRTCRDNTYARRWWEAIPNRIG